MSYARKHLASVEGYKPGEQPLDAEYIKLNTNENPYPPSPSVFEAIKNTPGDKLRKYPDAAWRRLRSKISTVFGANVDQIFVGNGSDEVLSLLIRTFVDPGERVLYTYPSYVLYETLAQLNAVEYEAIELDDNFSLPEKIFRAKGKILFIASPNSPTGNSVPNQTIARLCESFKGLVIADEAYADFSTSSCVGLLKENPNLVVLRTFSKSFSLASIRVGFALASTDIIDDLMKTKDSYNVNLLSQLAAEAALDDLEYMRANAKKIIRTRERLSESLRKLGFMVYPSESNFVLAKYSHGSAKALYEELKKRKVLVRYFPLRRLEDSLRISIGTDDEVNILLSELEDILKK